MVVRAADLAALVTDPDSDSAVESAEVGFSAPVVADAALVDGSRTMHAVLGGPASRLAREEVVARWLRALIDCAGSDGRRGRSRSRRRDQRALRAALGYLAEHSGRNVGLDELAAVAGVGRFQLIDAFREGTGLAPHAFQLARRLLEGGATIADTAAATGFADQSHLHRHFRRSLGMTPREYQHRFVAGREEQTRLCSRRRSTGQVTRPVAPGWSSTP